MEMIGKSESNTGVVWIFSSQATLLLSNFLLLKILTTKLGVYEFGQFALFMSFTLFVRQVVYDPFSIVLGKECAANATDQVRLRENFRAVKFITDLLGVVILIFCIVFFIYSLLFSSGSDLTIFVVCCLVYICGNGTQGIYFNVLNSVKDRKPAALFSMADSVLKLALVFLFFLIVDKTLKSTLVAVSLGVISVCLISRYFILKKYSCGWEFFSKEYKSIKLFLVMSSPFFFSSLLIASKSVGDRWVLAGFLGVNELAEYSVLLQIGYSPIMLFFGILQTFVAPKIYGFCSLAANNSYSELLNLINRILLFMLIITCMACSVAIVAGDWIFKILVGGNYHKLTLYLPFFILSGSFSAAAGIFQVAIIGVLKSSEASTLVIISLFIGVVATILLIFVSGFNGAVAGLIVSNLITMLIFWKAIHYRVRKIECHTQKKAGN